MAKEGLTHAQHKSQSQCPIPSVIPSKKGVHNELLFVHNTHTKHEEERPPPTSTCKDFVMEGQQPTVRCLAIVKGTYIPGIFVEKTL
jgi:hypothetical protein